MADIVVNFGATDDLSLGSNFIAQPGDISRSQETATMLKANGDIQKYASPFNLVDTVTRSYRWSETTGLGTALTSLCGDLKNAYIITEVRVESVYNDFPMIHFTAHNHNSNAHAETPSLPTFDIDSAVVTAITGAFGAYDFFGKASATVAIVRSSYTISLTHVDEEGATGNHWVGTNIRGNQEATCDYLGDAGTPDTVSGWTVTGYSNADSNEEHDKSSITATKLAARS